MALMTELQREKYRIYQSKIFLNSAKFDMNYIMRSLMRDYYFVI